LLDVAADYRLPGRGLAEDDAGRLVGEISVGEDVAAAAAAAPDHDRRDDALVDGVLRAVGPDVIEEVGRTAQRTGGVENAVLHRPLVGACSGERTRAGSKHAFGAVTRITVPSYGATKQAPMAT